MRIQTISAVTALVMVSTVMSELVDAQGQVEGHDLAVEVTDVKGEEGQIIIALFTKSDGFPAEFEKAAKVANAPTGKPTFTFENLPAGKYVVVVGHDRNGNGKIDRSKFGLPREPIGLSYHPKISPPANLPNFEKAKVDLSRDSSVQINLIDLGM